MKDLSEETGQTMVEYLLLVLVVVAVSISVFRRLDEYIVSNPDSFQNRYLQGFRNVLTNGVEGQYKRYRIPR